jgi:hypothetical protein
VLASFIQFESPSLITCIFDVEPVINFGYYSIKVSNNNYQFVTLIQKFEVLQTAKIINVWPSVFFVNP